MNLFERPATICYCVPQGSSLCAPCRERRKHSSPLMDYFSKRPPKLSPEDVRDLWEGSFSPFPNLDLSKHEFQLSPKHFTLTPDDPCPNCGQSKLFVVHHLDGCSCHINPPCGYCTEQRLNCSNCDLFIDIESA